MERFFQICKEANLNITPQRILIFKELSAHHNHPDAEAIYKRVKAQFPNISFATIYKTLDTFVKIGLLSQFRSSSGTIRYDTNTDHHHHLICVSCDRVIDINHKSLNNIPVTALPIGKFKVLNHRVELKGICESCQQTKKTQKQSKPKN